MADVEKILAHLGMYPKIANLETRDDIERFASGLEFDVKYKGNRGRFKDWFLKLKESYIPVLGDSLVYALSYQNGDNVAHADDLLRSLTASGVIRPVGLESSLSTRAFIGLERRRRSGTAHYAREFSYELCRETPEVEQFMLLLQKLEPKPERNLVTEEILEGVKILFRDTQTLSLWGIPHLMRSEVGQQPSDLWNSTSYVDRCAQAAGFYGKRINYCGPRDGWVYLGAPGWWGGLTEFEQTIIKTFLAQFENHIPAYPNEWDVLPREERRRQLEDQSLTGIWKGIG